MTEAIQIACLTAFLGLTVLPSLYSVHLYALMFLAGRRRRQTQADQRAVIERYQRETPDDQWPTVTTQIPLYNELTVARRVIEAVAQMDYPRGRHEVQVLDDSTDGTREIVDQVAASLRSMGHDVKVVRRPTREHYKAGALAHGLATARGEFVAVFDADFMPGRTFLRQLIPLFSTDPRIGCVQGRWGHLNTNESWITEALSIGIDGHFGVEQGARGWNGYLLNFNGTAGIWRKAAIDDERVGGWQGDTLTEDLDLSYRAQLAGWRIEYCVDEVCPAEIPANVAALKTQQRRWALGSIQTARKLLPEVWRSPALSLLQKIEASIHLTQYSIAVYMVLMIVFGRALLLFVPPEMYQSALRWSWGLVLLAMAAPSAAYIYARWAMGGGLVGPVRLLKLIIVGLGLSVNNGAAVLAGLIQRGGEFVRTPKSGSTDAAARKGAYAAVQSRLWLVELLIGALCFAQWLYFLQADRYVGGTFLLLFAIGLTALGWGSRPQFLRAAPARSAVRAAGHAPAEPTASAA